MNRHFNALIYSKKLLITSECMTFHYWPFTTDINNDANVASFFFSFKSDVKVRAILGVEKLFRQASTYKSNKNVDNVQPWPQLLTWK